MALKNILVVPVRTLIDREASSGSSIVGVVKRLKRSVGTSTSVYDAEIMFMGDLPKVLGAAHVFQLGAYYPHLHDAHVPSSAPYPSAHGTPEATVIRERDVEDVLSKVDAVFVSTRSGEAGDTVRTLAKKRDIPIAMIDMPDHAELYGSSHVPEELTYSFVKGRDFDLYFKKDLPLGYRSDSILPLVPVPVRPESYRFPKIKKDLDIFYSGRTRSGCQADRPEAVDAVTATFENVEIIEHDIKRKTFFTVEEYWRDLARARFALSPSGKSWDSFRHTETGLSPLTALVAPKPYIETTGPALEDGKNAVLYDVVFRDGKYHLADAPALIERIRYYLDHQDEREMLANTWQSEVREGHTILARSRYIIQEMEKAFA